VAVMKVAWCRWCCRGDTKAEVGCGAATIRMSIEMASSSYREWLIDAVPRLIVPRNLPRRARYVEIVTGVSAAGASTGVIHEVYRRLPYV
jgi:hypothetical protein